MTIQQTIMSDNFPQINVKYQTTDFQRSSENAKEDKFGKKNKTQQKLYLSISFSNYSQSEVKKKS